MNSIVTSTATTRARHDIPTTSVWTLRAPVSTPSAGLRAVSFTAMSQGTAVSCAAPAGNGTHRLVPLGEVGV